MNAEQFFNTVAQMRAKQKEYFRTRSSAALTDSKRLEKIVDAEIQRVREIIKGKQEPKLF